ncbi:hypothetical protein R1sor_027354 [Riccia sorocarpa]|uniref:Uncharacterized protein n=1 Tax=Riccia sorocarpa TaxID=122646 RepID=A0ABD3GFG8_9MARC
MGGFRVETRQSAERWERMTGLSGGGSKGTEPTAREEGDEELEKGKEEEGQVRGGRRRRQIERERRRNEQGGWFSDETKRVTGGRQRRKRRGGLGSRYQIPLNNQRVESIGVFYGVQRFSDGDLPGEGGYQRQLVAHSSHIECRFRGCFQQHLVPVVEGGSWCAATGWLQSGRLENSLAEAVLMAMVEPDLSSMFGLHHTGGGQRGGHHHHQNGGVGGGGGQHHMMDWSSPPSSLGVGVGVGVGVGLNRGLLQNEELVVPSYLQQQDMFQPQAHNPFNPFDMSDYHPQQHVVKTEPQQQQQHSASSAVVNDYDYLSLPQVGSGSCQYQTFNNNHPSTSFISSSSTNLLNFSTNPASSAAAPGGVLEEIDGILKHFDLPQQHQQQPRGLVDVDPLGELFQQAQGGSGGGGGGGGLFSTGMVGVQDAFGGLMSSIEDTAVEDLAKSLQVEIMSENSQVGSTLDSCSMTSDNGPFNIYGSASQAAMHGGYLNSSSARGGSAPQWQQQQQQQQQRQQKLQQQVQLVKPQSSPSAMSSNTSGYHNVDSPASAFNFQRPAAAPPAYGPSQYLGLQEHQQQRSHHQELGRLQQQLNNNNNNNNSDMHFSNTSSGVMQGSVLPATGLQLVHLLLGCAEAVAESNLELAKVILVRLRGHVLPDGNPMQRLAAYFEQALRARLTKDNDSPIFKGLTGDKSIPQAEVLEAFSVFYDSIPIGKFGHLTCNQILLDAVERERVVHVLDLQIWHGMQWPAFLQALAMRPGGPPKLRMTALGVNPKDLKETGDKLVECARNLNVPFEFCPLLTELANFDTSMLDIRRGEVLVVNSFVQFHCILNKGNDVLGNILRGLRRLQPRVVAFAENDGNHNSPSFLTRFVECLRYYSAVFDAFDATLPSDSPARMKMEQIFAAQKIRNIIACDGPARVDGHETMRYWHKRMENCGFRNTPLSSRAVSQANLLLNLYYSNGYTLNPSECGYLALGWHGMPLMGVSAWQ